MTSNMQITCWLLSLALAAESARPAHISPTGPVVSHHNNQTLLDWLATKRRVPLSMTEIEKDLRVTMEIALALRSRLVQRAYENRQRRDALSIAVSCSPLSSPPIM